MQDDSTSESATNVMHMATLPRTHAGFGVVRGAFATGNSVARVSFTCAKQSDSILETATCHECFHFNAQFS